VRVDDQLLKGMPYATARKGCHCHGFIAGNWTAIAQRLENDGANVVVTYSGNRDKAEEVVSTIEAGGAKAIAIQLDVQNLEEIQSLFYKAIEHFGKIDILVNNAAGKNIFKPTAEMTVEEYKYGAKGTRIPDPCNAIAVLYQLSYSPVLRFLHRLLIILLEFALCQEESANFRVEQVVPDEQVCLLRMDLSEFCIFLPYFLQHVEKCKYCAGQQNIG
jgi:hypothetical protein